MNRISDCSVRTRNQSAGVDKEEVQIRATWRAELIVLMGGLQKVMYNKTEGE